MSDFEKALAVDGGTRLLTSGLTPEQVELVSAMAVRIASNPNGDPTTGAELGVTPQAAAEMGITPKAM